MKIAYSYIRFSNPEQSKGDSLRRQLKMSQDWCERFKYILDDSLNLHDLGVSAFKGKNKTQGKLGAFMDAVDQGRVKKGSVLLVESLDRLSREEVPEALELFLGILRRGIIIVTLNPEDRFEKKTLNEIQLIIAIIILSRAHEESATKSKRLSESWKNKRENIHEKKLTSRCPNWLTLNEDRTQFVKVPEAVATVKQIFRWAIDGHGATTIVKRLHEKQIKPIGTANCWYRSTVLKMLNNRAVMGEFQPRHGTGGTNIKNRPVAGDAIPDYYPAIIKEADFYKSQKELASRKLQKGPIGKKVSNLFTGLVRDARDGSTMELVDKGKRSLGPVVVSSAARRGENGAEYISFPYPALEKGILNWTSEIKPQDIIPAQSENNALQDQLEAAQGRILDIEKRIKVMQKRLKEDKKIESIMDVLEELDSEKDETVAKVEKLKAEIHSKTDDNLSQAKEIILLLENADGDDLIDLRTRLKARLRSLISEIWVLVFVDGHKRIANLQIFFHGGGMRYIRIQTDHGSLEHTFGTPQHDTKPAADFRKYRHENDWNI